MHTNEKLITHIDSLLKLTSPMYESKITSFMYCVMLLQEILQTRFPMPRYIITDQGGSQVNNCSGNLQIPPLRHKVTGAYVYL